MSNSKNLVLYGAPWCGYCLVLKKKLDSREVEYDYKDVDEPGVREEMNQKTNGNQTIPVLLREDDFWVNPDDNTLKGVLNG